MTFQADHMRPLLRLRAPSQPTALRRLHATAVWLMQWFWSFADHYSAALLYDRLSRLSDTELERRGLSRSSLAYDLICMHEAARTASGPVDAERVAAHATRARQP